MIRPHPTFPWFRPPPSTESKHSCLERGDRKWRRAFSLCWRKQDPCAHFPCQFPPLFTWADQVEGHRIVQSHCSNHAYPIGPLVPWIPFFRSVVQSAESCFVVGSGRFVVGWRRASRVSARGWTDRVRTSHVSRPLIPLLPVLPVRPVPRVRFQLLPLPPALRLSSSRSFRQ